MKLSIMTPTQVVLEEEVAHVTAEDVTGSLGIRAGHAPLVTVLVPGVVTARNGGGSEQYVAVNGGVMQVDGDTVRIVSRQAVTSGDLGHLESTVVAGFEKAARDDQTNHAAFEKMRVQFMKGVLDFERAEG